MRVKLSLMGDMCMPRPGLLSMHEVWRCLEMPTPIMWMPGFALQQNKLSKTVFHKSQFMALENHDCGHWIPHIWLPPTPPAPVFWKLPVIIAFSKRKVMFSSSTVKAEDSQIACSQIDSTVPLPMLTCGSPVPLPNSYPVFNGLHNVSINLTVGDLVAGIMAIIVTVGGEGLIKMKKLDEGLKVVWKELVGAGNFQHFCLKAAIGLAVSAARLVGTHETELKLELFSAYAGGKASIESKRDGRLGFSAQAQIFTGTRSAQGKASQVSGDGKVVDKRSLDTVEWNRSRSESTTDTSYNNGGKQRQTRTVLRRGGVDPSFDGKTANSFASTLQGTDTVPSDGPSTFSSGHFQGTSNAQGDWGEAL